MVEIPLKKLLPPDDAQQAKSFFLDRRQKMTTS
jgi:hypothetical protein